MTSSDICVYNIRTDYFFGEPGKLSQLIERYSFKADVTEGEF